MKGKEKQRPETKLSKEKKNMAASSSDDEDSDVERNYALLTKRGGGGGGGAEEGEPHHGGEEDFSDEEEEGSDGGTEEEGGEEGSEVGEEASDGGEEEKDEEEEEDEDSEASEEDVDEDPEEEAGGSSEINTAEDIKKELSTMSFEDIMELQNKVGTKVYNEVAYGSNKTQGTSKKKRLNKNRPMEISAKRRAPFLRQVVSVKKPTLRDPRFDDLSGEYKPEIFEKTFKFINDIKQKEREIIQKKLKKTKKNIQKKEELQFLLKRMDNQERARKSREEQRERELQFKREQRERANQGARPFFLKNSDKKKLQLAEKYQELKKSGKLENFLSKKRKRNAGKDRRKLPRQLQNTNFQ
ncbi:ribosomal RNA processing protein 36 homolog [Anoplopoma fimbria]|uniref:ribosomal RNA processing protein 36 homolog n=1 Tax=Anoplopoma fimbria TaxID=229290 RepID=UPI0023EDC995|nr:ribosomal RNA processing protein 36 homolog [Anoplopoma fimbria]